MLKENLEKMIEEVLITYIAERVMEKIANRDKKILLIFTGSPVNLDEALTQLSKLGEKGFTFHVFLSESAKLLLDYAKIEQRLHPIFVDEKDCKIPELFLREFDAVIVPTMTRNTAAKIACGIADNPASRFLSNALLKGKKVVIAIDGCCPDHKKNAENGYQMKEAFKVQLRDNMKKLASFGAYLTTAECLYESAVLKIVQRQAIDEKEYEKTVDDKRAECKVLSNKVVGNVDIVINSGYQKIIIGRNSLVTRLAEDTAKKNKIQLIRE
ncbi:flavoprotein [Sinanaerobacter sp. ZZT-01]|uniref:flavoprotein n=1 Tax=Sinanaerobacter sp. ZZT-01 TaxID=3111540 RepID=UPI002D77B398|nr:flavoprotein [Sinanaerobacter sp. ZZT-01]WRR92630.1 flavoprotein [Sinanaerobacter sp. ZZT-01]